jgi:TDG/mug DNA glycosylase family protein
MMSESPVPLPTFGDVFPKYYTLQSLSDGVTRSSHRTIKSEKSDSPSHAQVPSCKLSKHLTAPALYSSPIKSRKTSSKKKRSSSSRYAPPSKYAFINNLLTDAIAPNLITLFIGLNPGISTATSGHAYAHPSNRFWKLMHSSGCTPRLCLPAEDGDMPRLFGLGLTNIVTRPTKDGAELSKSEMDDGVAELERKIQLYQPETIAVVGKSIWESIWRVRHGRGMRKEEFWYGWQADEERMGGGALRDTGEDAVDRGHARESHWVGARVFVTTTTSGLAASMSLKEKEEVWSVLGTWVKRRREEKLEAAAAALEGTV